MDYRVRRLNQYAGLDGIFPVGAHAPEVLRPGRMVAVGCDRSGGRNGNGRGRGWRICVPSGFGLIWPGSGACPVVVTGVLRSLRFCTGRLPTSHWQERGVVFFHPAWARFRTTRSEPPDARPARPVVGGGPETRPSLPIPTAKGLATAGSPGVTRRGKVTCICAERSADRGHRLPARHRPADIPHAWRNVISAGIGTNDMDIAVGPAEDGTSWRSASSARAMRSILHDDRPTQVPSMKGVMTMPARLTKSWPTPKNRRPVRVRRLRRRHDDPSRIRTGLRCA